MRNITNNTPKGANLGSPVVKTNDTDKKGTFYAYQSIGGLVPVLNEEDRNSIPVDTKLNEDGYTSGQRELGMVVWYMLSDKLELWRLYIPDYDSLNTAQKIAALGNNGNWIEAELGTTSTWQGNWVSGMTVIPDGVVVYDDDLYQSTRTEEFVSNTNPSAAGNTYFKVLSKQDLSDYITTSELSAYDLDLRGGLTGSLQGLSDSLEGQINEVSDSVGTISGRVTTVENALPSKADLVGGVVPANQLPSYVDDVLEGTRASATVFNDPDGNPYTPESDKIYVDTVTNITYRWSGSAYVAIGSDLALGETSSTAYRGDRGKTAYDHSQTTGNPHDTTKSDVGLGNVDNTSDLSKPISTAQAAVNTILGNRIDGIESSYKREQLFSYMGGSKTFTFQNGDTPTSILVFAQKPSPNGYINVIPAYSFVPNATSFTITDSDLPAGSTVKVIYWKGTIPVNAEYVTTAEFDSLVSIVNTKQDAAQVQTLIAQNQLNMNNAYNLFLTGQG